MSVGLDTGEIDAQIEEVKAKLAELDGTRVEVSIGLPDATVPDELSQPPGPLE